MLCAPTSMRINDQIILEEDYDECYQPTQEGMCRWCGEINGRPYLPFVIFLLKTMLRKPKHHAGLDIGLVGPVAQGAKI